MRRPRGFTLLEVLIALTILAVTALAVARQVGGGVAQLQRLEQKTLALQLAENELSRLREGSWPNPSSISRSVTYMDQRWLVTTEINPTADPYLRRMTVDVAVEGIGGEETPLISLSAFRGRY